MTDRERYISERAERELRAAINAITEARRLLPEDFAGQETLKRLWVEALGVETLIRDARKT